MVARQSADGRIIQRPYTPQNTAIYEGIIRSAAVEAMGERLPLTGPVVMVVLVILPIPSSWSKRRQQAAASGALWPAKKPDLTNVLKAIEDACNRVVFADDAQIVEVQIRKRFGFRPRVVVVVREAESEGAGDPPA